MTKKVKSPQLLSGLKTLGRRLGTLVRQPIFIFITLWGHAAILAGTVGFYWFEKDINPRIHSLLDTFYWAVATVTTVGYGDAAPVTVGGKWIGIAMMILGSLFLWSYTALFAGGLVAPEIRMVEDEVRKLEANVEEVEQKIQLDEKTAQELLREIQTFNSGLKQRRDFPPL